jgi:hypothetical protein
LLRDAACSLAGSAGQEFAFAFACAYTQTTRDVLHLFPLRARCVWTHWAKHWRRGRAAAFVVQQQRSNSGSGIDHPQNCHCHCHCHCHTMHTTTSLCPSAPLPLCPSSSAHCPRFLAVGCWLLAVGCWLAGCWLAVEPIVNSTSDFGDRMSARRNSWEQLGTARGQLARSTTRFPAGN